MGGGGGYGLLTRPGALLGGGADGDCGGDCGGGGGGTDCGRGGGGGADCSLELPPPEGVLEEGGADPVG